MLNPNSESNTSQLEILEIEYLCLQKYWAIDVTLLKQGEFRQHVFFVYLHIESIKELIGFVRGSGNGRTASTPPCMYR
jgi:hypothetical protein